MCHVSEFSSLRTWWLGNDQGAHIRFSPGSIWLKPRERDPYQPTAKCPGGSLGSTNFGANIACLEISPSLVETVITMDFHTASTGRVVQVASHRGYLCTSLKSQDSAHARLLESGPDRVILFSDSFVDP